MAPQMSRTQWHRLLAKLFELLLTPLGISVHTEMPVISEPPKIDILLLRRRSAEWTVAQLHLLCDGLRHTLAANLVIEFKFSESFNATALLQALSYDFLFRQAQKLAEHEVQTFIMLARTPHVKILEQFGYHVAETAGVYRSHLPLVERVQLIVLNQLRPEAHNVFVQAFATRRRIRMAAFERLRQSEDATASETVWDLVAGLRTQFEKREDDMGKTKIQEPLTPESVIKMGREMRQFVLGTLSPRERLAGLTAEELKSLFAAATPEERKTLFAAATPEDRKALFAAATPEERLAGLSPEELAELMHQIEVYLRQQP